MQRQSKLAATAPSSSSDRAPSGRQPGYSSSDEEQSAASAQPGSSCSHRACDSWMNTCESAVYFAEDQGSLNNLKGEFNCAVQNKSKSWSETDRTLHFTWRSILYTPSKITSHHFTGNTSLQGRFVWFMSQFFHRFHNYIYRVQLLLTLRSTGG